MKYHFLLVVGALLALASCAFAYPTLSGPTGSISLPDAEIAPAGTLDAAVDWVDSDEADEAFPIRATFGLAPNWEVGAAYTSQGGGLGEDLNSWGIHAKYRTAYTLADAAWAIGARFEDFVDQDSNATQVYLVGTKRFTAASEGNPGLTASLGVSWTRFDNGDSEDAFRPYLLASLDFANNATLVAEYQFKDSDVDDDPIAGVALRYPFNPNLTGQVGITNSFRGVHGSSDQNIFAGVTFRWGGMAEEESEY